MKIFSKKCHAKVQKHSIGHPNLDYDYVTEAHQ